MKPLFSYLFLLLFISISYAQDFGEVSEAELKMTRCEEEPDADVVILFDKCSARITSDFNLEVKYHKRIKILTEEGKEYANIKIPYWHEDNIYRLDAISFSPDGEEYELDSDNIFEEEGEKVYTISFAIPGVEIGSVIEYEYTHWSKYIARLEPWVFQDENFTRLSQLSVQIPQGFNFIKLSLNDQNYGIKESVEEFIDRDNRSKKIVQYTWTGTNIPGIKEEPYVDNLNDKYAKTHFILESYKSPYRSIVFTKSWDDVAETISKKYNDLISEDGLSESATGEIIGTEADGLAKAKLIYNYVKSEIKLGDHKSLYGDEFKEPEEVLETKEGSSSDKNMLLINMLTHAGLDAKPVFISTKKHGSVIQEFRDRLQFNRLICRLKIENKSYFLNAAYKANPFGYLTPSTDVEIGFLVDDDKGKIISLKPFKIKNKTDFTTTGTINEDGLIEAKTKITYSGYPALLERINLEDEIESEREKIVEKLIEKLYAGAELDTFYYKALDDYENPLVLYVEYRLPDYVDESEDLVYFAFPLFSAISENPFKREKRNYSVDFNYTQILSENSLFHFPSNLSLLEIPKKSKLSMKEFSYVRRIIFDKEYVKCTRVSSLKERTISHRYYSELKDLYEGMISADQEQLVFKKNEQHINVESNSEGI